MDTLTNARNVPKKTSPIATMRSLTKLENMKNGGFKPKNESGMLLIVYESIAKSIQKKLEHGAWLVEPSATEH